VTDATNPDEPAHEAPEDRPGSGYTGGIGSRREARDRAVALLYEAEAKSETAGELLASLPVAPEEFTVELLEGVDAHRDAIDELLTTYARDWKLERMPALDRAVLRVATYELAYRPEIPLGAVISEAVELAKTYSTEESGKFVNGLLSAIGRATRDA
jgi:N utilization substance protein B